MMAIKWQLLFPFDIAPERTAWMNSPENNFHTSFPGKIVANQTVDFEQVQWLNFTIRAKDHGSPPRIAELPVYLRIVDVNDNNPVFLQPSYQVLIRMSGD